MVEIVEANTKKLIRKFVQFPSKLYKGVAQYVPPMYAEELELWDKDKNPAFDYCEAKCFLAYRDGEIVGRIAAILSNKANARYKNKRMRFSSVDFIDDQEVVDALFNAVEKYAKEKDCEEMQGPLGFSDFDREGMLVEGFDKRAMFITYYNFPYYVAHMERLGYVKDIDWLEYKLITPKEENAKLNRISDLVLKQNKLHLLEMKRQKDIVPHIESVFRLYNTAYDHLYGVVPLTDKQIAKIVKQYLPIINKDYCYFVMDENNEVAAFGITAPSLAEALRKCDGKLFPFGWAGLLKALYGKARALDLFLIAVKPELQGQGVNAVLLNCVLKSALKNGIEYAETGPELETNESVQSQWRFFETIPHKRRRCFIKPIK